MNAGRFLNARIHASLTNLNLLRRVKIKHDHREHAQIKRERPLRGSTNLSKLDSATRKRMLKFREMMDTLDKERDLKRHDYYTFPPQQRRRIKLTLLVAVLWVTFTITAAGAVFTLQPWLDKKRHERIEKAREDRS